MTSAPTWLVTNQPLFDLIRSISMGYRNKPSLEIYKRKRERHKKKKRERKIF